MEETDNDVSKNSDEATGNTFENLASELADYREELFRLVLVPKNNSFKEKDKRSTNGSKTVKKPAKGRKECLDLSIKGYRIREKFSVNNKIKISDLGIRDFHPRNIKNTSKKAMISNVITVSEKPRKRSDLMIFSNSKKTSETLNTSCHGTEEMACTSNADYRSEAPTNNSDKDTNASLDCNSQKSSTDLKFSDSDSSIASLYLKISEKYLGASSTRMFTEENLWRFCSAINQDSSEGDSLNCNSETLANPANYSLRSTKVSTSFITTDEDRSRQKLELKSSDDPEAVFDNTFSDSNPNSVGVLKASDRNSESRSSGLNISNRDSEISHPILKVSDTDRVAEPDKESSEVLWTKLRNLVKTFDEFQDAAAKAFEDLIEDFSVLAPTLDNDREPCFSSGDAETHKEVPAETTNIEDEYDSLSTPICSPSPASNSIPSNVCRVSDHLEYWNSDFKLSESDEESFQADLMFSDRNNESKSDNRSSNALHVQKELQNPISTNDEVQDFGQEEIIAAEAFSNIELTSDNDLETYVCLPETKGNEVITDSTIADDQCDRLESLAYSDEPNISADFQNISKEIIAAEEFSNLNLTSDDNLVTSVGLPETTIHESASDSTIVNNQCDRLESFAHSDEPSTSDEFHNINEEVTIAEEFSNLKVTLIDDLGTSVSSHETKGKEISAHSKNTENECDRIEALLCTDPNKGCIADFHGIGQEVINTEALSSIEHT